MNPTYNVAAPPPQLKSCLRQGHFSRARVAAADRGGGGATVMTQHSSVVPCQAALLQQYQCQQQYEQQYQQHQSYHLPQQQLQAREEEECSVRSTSSAPTVRSMGAASARSIASEKSASSAPTIRSAPSTASSATTVTRRGNGHHNDRNDNSSIRSRQSNGRHDHNDASSTGGTNLEDDEREFMRISKLLVTQHKAGNTATQQLVHAHMPTYEQRRSFYNNLQRNVAYLPMFPEPNEHPGLAITRYVDKMFGPTLTREDRDGVSSEIGCSDNQSAIPTSSRGYNMQRYPQHHFSIQQSQYKYHTAFSDTRQPRQNSGRNQLSLPQHNDHPGCANNRQPQPASYKLDDPMFPPPHMIPRDILQNHDPSRAEKVSTTNYNIPPPILMSSPSPELPPPSTQNVSMPNFFPANIPTTLASNTPIIKAETLHHRPYQQTPMASYNAPILNAPPHRPPPFTHHKKWSNFSPASLPTPSNSPTPLASNTTSILKTATLPHQSYQQTPIASNNAPILKAPIHHHHPSYQEQYNVTFAKSSEASQQSSPPDPKMQQRLQQQYQQQQQQMQQQLPADQTRPVLHQVQQLRQSQPPSIQETQQTEKFRIGVPSASPLPKPLSFSSMSNNSMLGNKSGYPLSHAARSVASINNKSLIGSSIDDSSFDSSIVASDLGLSNIEGKHANSGRTQADYGDATSSPLADSGSIFRQNQYQTFSDKDMLPPMTSREKILYYPRDASIDAAGGELLVEGPMSPSCCNGACDPADPLNVPREKRPPNFLQLYIKCERSEPFINNDLDIVTWYRNAADNKVTADRTLVVQNSVSLAELIRGIVESFGLATIKDDGDDDGAINVGADVVRDEQSSSSLLGCYNNVCFVSDIKTTKSGETAQTHLTPLPIPGMYYKYVERNNCDNAATNHNKNKEHRGRSTVLSTDPMGLQRTVVAQVLDKPVYESYLSSPSPKGQQYHEDENKGVRNRLALVYCTPKRRGTISSRSIHHGTLPETIYHFQILLEGIVAKDDLPSSFVSQTRIRCVGATGGVCGGSVIDTQGEIDELNRSLWKDNGPRDVVGLAAPVTNRHDNLEQIIDLLGVPLFDIVGHQTPKEFVVDRCLYNIYSGILSMEVARKTQHTMEAIEGSTEWLARRMGDLTNNLTESAKACDATVEEYFFDDERLGEFDRAVNRLGIAGSKTC